MILGIPWFHWLLLALYGALFALLAFEPLLCSRVERDR